MKNLALSLTVILSLSCDVLIGPDPENTPENNFEILWKEFDRYYSFFELKGINWDSLYGVYRLQVNANTNGPQLFSIMSSLLSQLKDGHASLYTPHGNYFYEGYYAGSPNNFQWNVVRQVYLKNTYRVVGNGAFLYGRLHDSLGYIYIPSFGSGSFGAIDEILSEFNDVKALIIDVRDNGGGSSDNAETVAQRFLTEQKLIHYIRWRNGPRHSDFTDYIPRYLDPAGVQFTKPVAILTNRKCYSATEDFVLSLKDLWRVMVVGDLTGGGSGNPVFRELPNGWTYRLSRWISYGPDKRTYEGLGIYPETGRVQEGIPLSGAYDPIMQAALSAIAILQRFPNPPVPKNVPIGLHTR